MPESQRECGMFCGSVMETFALDMLGLGSTSSRGARCHEVLRSQQDFKNTGDFPGESSQDQANLPLLE